MRPLRQRSLRRKSKLQAKTSAVKRQPLATSVHPGGRTAESEPRTPHAKNRMVASATLMPPEGPPAKSGQSLGPLISGGAFGEAPHGQFALVAGRSGDHPSVYQTLINVFQGPSRSEFQSQLDDPFYEPLDRLLVRRGHRVLSHLHLTRRTMRFGQSKLPIAGVHWLATLPEFRSQGFASRLLLEAERRIAADGGLLAVVRTSIPHFFARHGWAICGRQSVAHGEARLVLGHLQRECADRFARRLSIRLWRHFELRALMRIYEQNIQLAYGPLHRTETYWRWLINRKAFDTLLVAIDGRDRLELDDATAPIVGYAALRQGRVAELLTAPGHPTATHQLLARACAESVERDRRELIVHAPIEHRLHDLVISAGGTYCNTESSRGEVSMMKIVDPAKLLAAIAPELDRRAKQAHWRRDTELGLCVDSASWRLLYTRTGIRVRGGPLGRHRLTMSRAELTRLICGRGNVRETAAAGRIRAATKEALNLADVLFPKFELWRPMWDDLTAF
ncbi:MAG: GNAT family N-acetyltransferase [Pirellulales bacterium]|nr:GNAT family N-acetyltransferase [Pirellulales bacterium]